MKKWCVLLMICIGIFSSCVTASKQPKQTKEKQTCLQVYDGLIKKSRLFVGFGSAYTLTSAVEAARADLAMQIRTTVEGQFSSFKSNTSSSFSILTSSSFSEVLLGIKVVRRCSAKNGGYEAVVSLKRDLFLKNVSNSLSLEFAQVDAYLLRINEAKDEASLIRELLQAKRYLERNTAFVTATFCLTRRPESSSFSFTDN